MNPGWFGVQVAREFDKILLSEGHFVRITPCFRKPFLPPKTSRTVTGRNLNFLSFFQRDPGTVLAVFHHMLRVPEAPTRVHPGDKTKQTETDPGGSCEG